MSSALHPPTYLSYTSDRDQYVHILLVSSRSELLEMMSLQDRRNALREDKSASSKSLKRFLHGLSGREVQGHRDANTAHQLSSCYIRPKIENWIFSLDPYASVYKEDLKIGSIEELRQAEDTCQYCAYLLALLKERNVENVSTVFLQQNAGLEDSFKIVWSTLTEAKGQRSGPRDGQSREILLELCQLSGE